MLPKKRICRFLNVGTGSDGLAGFPSAGSVFVLRRRAIASLARRGFDRPSIPVHSRKSWADSAPDLCNKKAILNQSSMVHNSCRLCENADELKIVGDLVQVHAGILSFPPKSASDFA